MEGCEVRRSLMSSAAGTVVAAEAGCCSSSVRIVSSRI